MAIVYFAIAIILMLLVICLVCAHLAKNIADLKSKYDNLERVDNIEKHPQLQEPAVDPDVKKRQEYSERLYSEGIANILGYDYTKPKKRDE